MGVKRSKVVVVKDGSNNRRKSLMHKLGSYTLMYAVRGCPVGKKSWSPLLKTCHEFIRNEKGFVIENTARSPDKGFPYAKAVHNGHAGPIPPGGYAGNPWIRRGLLSAMKLLRIKTTHAKEE